MEADVERGAINPEDSIHIALTFDDGFWAPAYATMRSVCLATRMRARIVFHVCHLGLRADHRRDLETIASEFGSELRFHDVAASPAIMSVAARMPTSVQFPKIVYARLFLDQLLPVDITRVVYLDCDVMVRAPIEELWRIDLCGSTIAAAPDAWGPFYSIGTDMRINVDLYDPADYYFNSGVMLIDLARWRDKDLSAKLAALTQDGSIERLYYDQGFLNLVFKTDVQPLDWRWNFTSPKPEHERIGVAIFHYTGRSRPWHLFADVAFRRLYRHVMTNEIYYKFWRHRLLRALGLARPR